MDEPRGNVETQSAEGTTGTKEAPKTVSLTAYQKLQRRNAELASQLAAGSINNSSARVEELLQEVMGLLGDEAKPIKEKFSKRRETETQTATKFAKLNEIVENYDGDFETEPSFAEARAARDAGRWDEAIAMTSQVIATAKQGSPPDLDALVDAKVSEKLKALGKVDTGSSTVATGTRQDLKALIATDIRHMTPAQLAVYGKQLDTAYTQQTGGSKLS